MPPHLVLAGGGHAHLFVLEALAHGRFPSPLHVTLVTTSRRHVYSGMLPGFVGGRYRLDEILLNLGAITRAARVELMEAAVDAILPAERMIRLRDGRSVSYDLLSLAVGSESAGAGLPGVREHAIIVKPIDAAPSIMDALDRAASGPDPARPRVAVVGAGAGGIELALNLRARLRLLGRHQAPLVVVDEGDRILRDRSAACRRVAGRALDEHGIRTVLGTGVARAEEGRLALTDGRSVEADLVVWATGAAAPVLLRETGLALDERGFLRVNRSLQSVSHPEIFGAGDVATIGARPAPAKSGVYAVREGPVLRDNLAAVLTGRVTLRQYHPQRRFLALLNTGDGRAICSYGRFAASGQWAMRLKDLIDRRFMRRFGQLRG
jgi:selenide,water dikinase